MEVLQPSGQGSSAALALRPFPFAGRASATPETALPSSASCVRC